MRQAFVVETFDLSAHQVGAHVDATKVIFQIVRENTEQLILVFRELLELIACGFQRQLRPHARNEFGLVEWFGYIIHAAGIQRADNHVFVIGSGKKNDGNFFPLWI